MVLSLRLRSPKWGVRMALYEGRQTGDFAMWKWSLNEGSLERCEHREKKTVRNQDYNDGIA